MAERLLSSPDDDAPAGDAARFSRHLSRYVRPYLPVDDAEAAVRSLATEIVGSLSRTMAVLGVVQVPPFNEVTWTHYPDGRGHITGAGAMLTNDPLLLRERMPASSTIRRPRSSL